jgi:hypothetical protein
MTPKRNLGVAQRVTVAERQQIESEVVEEINEQDVATPTAAKLRNLEFNAPQYYDFTKEPSIDADKWFGIDGMNLDEQGGNSETPKVQNIFGHLRMDELKGSADDLTEKRKGSQGKGRSSNHKMILRKRVGKQTQGVTAKKIKRPSTTVPKPFNFRRAAQNIKENDPGKSPFVPLAVKLKELETATPDRFKKKPKV